MVALRLGLVSRATSVSLVAAILIVTGACTQKAPKSGVPPTTVTSPSAIGGKGPLVGATWRGRAPRPGYLLHDDGQVLWEVSVTGLRERLFEHPSVEVLELAASLDGAEVAALVILRGTASEQRFLYLFAPGKGAQLVDSSASPWSLYSPTFVTRADASGSYLYWLRQADDMDRAKRRVPTQLKRFDGSRAVEVGIGLRDEEWLSSIEGAPGGGRLVANVRRSSDIPTLYEVVELFESESRTDSPRLRLSSVTNTDSRVGSVWLSPAEFVVPRYVNESPAKEATLRYYLRRCLSYGSIPILVGVDFDPAVEAGPDWRLLKGSNDSVLVLTREDIASAGDGPIPFTQVAIPDGQKTRPGASWRPGAWSFVSGKNSVDAARDAPLMDADCGDRRLSVP